MRQITSNLSAVMALSTALVLTETVSAQWQITEDSSGLELGSIDGQGDWTTNAPDDAEVVADPVDDSNKVIAITNNSHNSYLPLAAPIPDGQTGTLFFRIYSPEEVDFVLGSSDVDDPGAWDHYEGYMRLAGINMDIRDGGGFAPVVEGFEADAWYNIWLVLDNDAKLTKLYYSLGSDPAVFGLEGAFRESGGNTEHGDLINFLVRTGNPHVGLTAFFDDVYVDPSGENLSNPVVPWKSVEDFDNLDEGTISGQGDWESTDPDNAEVTADPTDSDNQVLAVSGGAHNSYLPLSQMIPEDETGTLFFRVYAPEGVDFVLGSSDVVEPGAWDHYEGYMRFAGTNIDVRDGGGFSAAVEGFQADTWYNIWLVLDNDSKQTKLYYSLGSDPAELGQEGAFRETGGNTEHGDLINFLVRTGGSHDGLTAFLDDVFITTGENLSNPVPATDGGGQFESRFTMIQFDATTRNVALTWSSLAGENYKLDRSTDLEVWEEIEDGVESGGESTSFEDATVPADLGAAYYRIRLAE